jgi:hypothetical protein
MALRFKEILCLIGKYLSSVKVLVNDKHSSLLSQSLNLLKKLLIKPRACQTVNLSKKEKKKLG